MQDKKQQLVPANNITNSHDFVNHIPIFIRRHDQRETTTASLEGVDHNLSRPLGRFQPRRCHFPREAPRVPG